MIKHGFLESPSFIDDFPHLRSFTEDVLIKPSIEFSIATLDYRRVTGIMCLCGILVMCCIL